MARAEEDAGSRPGAVLRAKCLVNCERTDAFTNKKRIETSAIYLRLSISSTSLPVIW